MPDEFAEWKAEQSASWLRYMRDVKYDVARLQDEVEVARSLALPQGIDYTRPVVSSSPSADAIPNAVIRLQSLTADYIVELGNYMEELIDARERVNSLADSRHRAIITLYYLNGHTWATVAEKMNYSVDRCMQLRTEALPLLFDHLPREWKPMIPSAI